MKTWSIAFLASSLMAFPALAAASEKACQQTVEDDGGKSVAVLKAEIVSIAKANTTRTDNLVDVANRLRPLVAQLVSATPAKTASETLAKLEGTWHGLWSNLSYGPFAPDLAKTYQVVTTAGHYYNLSNQSGPNGPLVNALRGAYAPIPEGFAIRFTRNGFFSGTLDGRDGDDLFNLAAEIESGAQPLVSPPGSGFAVGKTGTLTTPYVDDDLRIVGGHGDPVFDDNGRVLAAGQYDLLFVLERQLLPIK